MLEELFEHVGQCHCKAVKFKVRLPAHIEAERCNCSICNMSGFVGVICPSAAFELIQGGELLTTYTFNTGVAKHTFCSKCGVKPFYTPRSNPDGFNVNIACLVTKPHSISIVDFDGVNWEAHAHKLAHKSKA